MLDSLFTMRSFGGTFTTDVHILLNDVSRFDATVSGFEVQASFNDILFLALDDRLDFAVGANGSLFGDMTEFQATLDPAPPETLRHSVQANRLRAVRSIILAAISPARSLRFQCIRRSISFDFVGKGSYPSKLRFYLLVNKKRKADRHR